MQRKEAIVMEFETADRAAARLGVGVRAVQKWAKDGKIPHAYKLSRVWMIPTDSVCPGEITSSTVEWDPFAIFRSYAPGSLRETVLSLKEEQEREFAFACYSYFVGDFDSASRIHMNYLSSASPSISAVSALFSMFSDLCSRREEAAIRAGEVLYSVFSKAKAGDLSLQEYATIIFCSTMLKLQLQIPGLEIPLLTPYLTALSTEARQFFPYISAYYAYWSRNYEKALGMVEMALSFEYEMNPIPRLYLYIIGSAAEISLGNVDTAMIWLKKAKEISEADGLILPFAEHYAILQGLIEKIFSKEEEAYRRIVSVANEFHLSWYRYSQMKDENIREDYLTHVELTVAMLYSRGWRAKEIASYLGMAERSVTNRIAVIYDKLHINSKKELARHLFQ